MAASASRPPLSLTEEHSGCCPKPKLPGCLRASKLDTAKDMEKSERHELTLHLHGATLSQNSTRSQDKSGVYAIAKVNGMVILQTPKDKGWDPCPQWDVSASTDVTGECNLSISLWAAKRFTRDMQCGSVSLPCSPDMGRLRNRDFTLTARNQPTGTVSVTIEFGKSAGPTLFCHNSKSWGSDAQGCAAAQSDPQYKKGYTISSMLTTCSVASGAEIDHLISWADDDTWSQGVHPPPLIERSERSEDYGESECEALLRHAANIELVTSADPHAGVGDGKKVHASEPAVAFMQYAPPQPRLPTPPPSPRIGSESSLFRAASIVEPTLKTLLSMPTFLSHRSLTAEFASMDAIVGSWRCTATQGLDEFLKRAGVGVFQRKLATAAKWPIWSFTLDGEYLHFVNHSAVGDLCEDIPVSGATYSWLDGHGNSLACTAIWQADVDGGMLRIERAGPLGIYEELRRVLGNQLEFTLLSDKCGSWGRSFVRSGPPDN